jgi:hypothetical protein
MESNHTKWTKLDKFGYACIDPVLMMEFVVVCLYLYRWTKYIKWNHTKISKNQLMGTLIERQGNRTLIHGLCQRVPLMEHKINVKDQNDPEEDARVFKLEEDHCNITVDMLSAAKLSRPERNLPLGLLAKIVSCEKIFKPVVRRTYKDRKRIFIARKLAILEAKKSPEQKEKESKQAEESRRWRKGEGKR